MKLISSPTVLSTVIAATLAPIGSGLAQDATDVLFEEVVVTARKRGEENVQDVPLSVTAYGADQIDALKVRDIESLSFTMPNVALDDIGTVAGVANFSIRGVGINSSIISIDPTVGVFIDGIYLGVNSGVVHDVFDLEAIEVLRGPQGILFGRNVTGGAVVLRTKKPTDELESSLRVAVESGFRDTGINTYLSGSVSGPLSDSWSGKLALYRNDNDGWHENLFDGSDHGASETSLIRPALRYAPNDSTEILLRYEHGQLDGDGPASQNHANGLGIPGAVVNFDRDEFDFSIDEPGFIDAEWDQATIEANFDVSWGGGTVTNIFGWRQYEADTLSDIDSTPAFLFHAPSQFEQEQFSNELRYAGGFGRVDLTMGLFYFEQDIELTEIRNLLGGALNQFGGGIQDQQTLGLFVSADTQLNDRWILTTGGRYTREEKDVQISSLIRNINTPCTIQARDCFFDFVDGNDWSNFSPKIGLQYDYSENLRYYGHWTRGFRSGGYNFRNTSGDLVNNGPGPFDEEQVDSFEIGLKSEPAGGRARFNAAVFFTQIDDQQREINQSDPVSGVVQVIKNTADTEIFGIELDGQFSITDNLVFQGSIGYLDAEYDRVLFDISGDGVIDDRDLALELPRAAPLTYNLGLLYDFPLDGLSGRVSFSHRDDSAYTDNNIGTLNEVDMVDAGFTWQLRDGLTVLSLYGKNLTDEVSHGGDTTLPSLLGPVPLGGSFAPLNEGRRIGLEATFSF